MTTPLNCLIVEDEENDALLVLHALRESYVVASERVYTPEAMRTALDRQLWDIVISDYKMPRFSGIAALHLLKQTGLDLPFIIVSGTIGEDLAAEAMREGAHDYVMKDNFARLVPAVQRELKNAVARHERRAADQKLQQMLALLDMAGRMALFGGWSVDLSDNQVTWTDEVARIHDKPPGYSPLVGEGINYYAPEWHENITKVFNACAKDGTPYDEEMEIITARGRRVWVRTMGEAERNAAGAIVRVRGAFQDITSLKQGKEKLVLNTAALTAAANAIIITDRAGTIVWANLAFSVLTGYTLPEVLGKNPRELLKSGRHEPAFYQEMWKTIQEGLVWRGEVVNRRKDGILYPEEMTITPVRNGVGEITHFIAIKHDLTERKQAEEALRVSEQRYRLLFDKSPIPMWLYDLETLRFLSVNEVAVRQYGYSLEEFLAMTIKDIHPSEDIPALLESVVTDRGADLRTSEWQHQRKDGSMIRVEIVSNPIVYFGRSARLVLAQDITEKRLLEEKFLHAQRLESIGTLAAGIAHDLNNVLSPIMLAAPMLRGSLQDTRNQRILDTLERSAGRGASLVKQILGFVRTTSDEFQVTQLKHILREVVSVIEETFPKSIQFEHTLSPELWTVRGNATQIHQVVLNLCVNARDAMPDGGTLRLTATNRRLDAKEAELIPGGLAGAWLVVEVSDTGTGIAPEMLESIWTPFFTTKALGKGTGLGLSTVRTIVARHGGFAELLTQVGQGTTFRIYLPSAEGSAPSAKSSDSPTGTIEGGGELILVVDDDLAVRTVVVTMLQEHGYRVLDCADGIEALEAFNAHPGQVPLLITDLDMPRLGGVALARALLEIQPDLRVLAISGLSHNEIGGSDVPTIRKIAHAFLIKPFKPEELLRVLQNLLHPTA